MKKGLEGVVVDLKTGEILTELHPGDRIQRKNSLEYLTDTIEINNNQPYIKVFTKTMFEVSKCLDGVTAQFLNFLIPYISYQTGILTYSNGKMLNRASLIALTGLHKDTVDKCLNKLITMKVLGKHKTGREVCYLANPFIFMKGNRVNKTLVKLFENSKWAKMMGG